MGSATTQALAATEAALATTKISDLSTSRELFLAARTIGESSQLSGALSAWGVPGEARASVAAQVFASLQPGTRSLVTTAAAQRWSSLDDLIGGIEALAIRAAAIAVPKVDVEGELFQVARTVAVNPELELALGSRLGDASAKGTLIEKILGDRTSEATTLIVSSLVQQPRERRVRSLLNRALRIVADQRGRTVATVYAAAPLEAEQLSRLGSSLSRRYGADVALNTVVDPSVVGGVRIEIGDDVIDATVSSRLNDLRQRLAG